MKSSSKFLTPLLLTTILLLVTACGSSGTPDAVATFNPMVTAAAQTMEALLTQAANQTGGQPTATQSSGAITLPTLTTAPTSTGFVLPVVTPYPTSVPTAITRCDWVSFISDVSVPDGTKYAPGTSFVKTWRLKNIGTCTWTSSYSLVFANGDQMGGAAAIALPGNVAPNQTVDVSVTLTAPATEKAYTGNWMLRNASGAVFGFGPTANSAFWAKITVADPSITAIVYDFVANYNLATWECAAGPTACTIGSTSDPLGFVMKLTSPHLENNTIGTDAALLTHPQNVNDGYITGTYPAFDVKSGDRFQAKLGCQYASTVCFLRFRLDYQVGADPIKNLGQWDEKTDIPGQLTTVNVDLNSLAGKSVVFFLKVQALGSPLQDDALWSGARITRTTSISNTNSCSYTVVPANNTTFGPNNSSYDITWTIKNTSSADWPASLYDFVHVSGVLNNGSPSPQDVPFLAKNNTLNFIIDMKTPGSNGTYSEVWQIKNGSTVICTMAATIKVVVP